MLFAYIYGNKAVKMIENTIKTLSLFGEIKLKIQICFRNENPYESTDFEAYVYLQADKNEESQFLVCFDKLDDLADYLYKRVFDETDSISQAIDKLLASIEEELTEFDLDAMSSSRQDEYSNEHKSDLDDLNRDYMAGR